MARRTGNAELLPWEQALPARLPIPGWSSGLLVSGALIAGLFVFRAALDLPLRDPGGTLTLGTRVSIALGLLIGILLFVSQYMAIAERADHREGPPQSPLLLARRTRLFFSYRESGRFARLARSRRPLHLFRLEGIEVYGRMALRRALAWILLLSVGTLMFGLNPDVTLASSLPMVPVVLLCIGFAGISVLAPLRVAHDGIAAAKRGELEIIDAAISGDRDAMRDSLVGSDGGDRSLADLIAYRGLVASIREWPFDGTTLSRLCLYLLIPVASWVGGALVERLASTLIDG